MDNFLNNGAILPSGLLGNNANAAMEGFNKTYKNTALRMGIIIRSYPVGDDNNLSDLTTEYDVSVFEQNEDKGSSVITYKNCMSSEGLGSIADFFERTLRVRETAEEGDGMINTTDQNGAVVLIMCLDGVSDKAIIMGAMTHPDRETTLVDDQPYLEGEYNGVNIKIDNDGSAKFTFNGATDNDGEIIDDSQGVTTIQVETDGSFQLDHETITFRLDRTEGTATLTCNKDVNINATGDVNVVAEGNATVQCVDVSLTASGKGTADISADLEVTVGGDCKATVSGKLVAQASEIDLNGSSGMVLTNVTDPVIDLITGAPTMGVPTVKAG